MSRRLVVEADGGSRGNPGPAGYGAVVKDADTGEVLAERAAGLGTTTNNVAEYSGLIAGLKAAAELDPAHVAVRMDSKLVVEQLSGRWKIKHPALQPLAREAMSLVRALPTVTFDWIPRAQNSYADRLANEAMDAAAKGQEWSAAPQKKAEPPRGWAEETGKAPTRTILLRHGQTEHSTERRFSGRNELPLTEVGRSQARAAAARLAGWPQAKDVAAVLTSPLRRGVETASYAATALGVELVEEPGLTEADFGVFEGLTFAEARDRHPAELAAWLADPDTAPPGGESFTAVARRVRRARDKAIASHPGRTVLLVSHVTPIKTLLRLGLEAGPSVLHRLHLDLAGLSLIDWHADGPASVRLVNDTSHLD